MFFEIWQVIVLIVITGLWGEWRAYTSYKKGINKGLDTMTDVAIKEIDKLETELSLSCTVNIVRYLQSKGLLVLDKDTGILYGYGKSEIRLDEKMSEQGKREDV